MADKHNLWKLSLSLSLLRARLVKFNLVYLTERAYAFSHGTDLDRYYFTIKFSRGRNKTLANIWFNDITLEPLTDVHESLLNGFPFARDIHSTK